jgi:RimJ/RimL family protein N-acetyltransferase
MIVIPDAPAVIGYVEQKLGIKIALPCQAFGYMTNAGKPIAGVVVSDYTGANCELTVVAEKGRMTREVIRHIASHVFHKLGCRRVTVRTRKRNKAAISLADELGFKYEHVAKHYYHDSDAVVFRLLRDECRWIKQ